VLRLLALLLWGVPNLVWLGWAIKEAGRELRALQAPPARESAVSPEQVPTQPQQVAPIEPKPTKKQKKRSGR
jgi:hypothetical protein